MARPPESQRERAVTVLKRAYAEGRLDHDEFEARAHRALAARTALELQLQLRGLVADDVRRRARRAAHLAGVVISWVFFSIFLAVSFVVALVATHASAWTLAFPLAWLAVSALALRAVRRS
jgi:uncharacterized membrane protein